MSIPSVILITLTAPPQLTFIHPSVLLTLLSIVHPPKPSQLVRSLTKSILFSHFLVDAELSWKYFLINSVQSLRVHAKSLHSCSSSLIAPDEFINFEAATLSFLLGPCASPNRICASKVLTIYDCLVPKSQTYLFQAIICLAFPQLQFFCLKGGQAKYYRLVMRHR